MSGTRLDRIGLLGVDSVRTRAYVHRLREEGLVLSQALMLELPSGPRRAAEPVAVPGFDNVTPAIEVLRSLGTQVRVSPCADVNAPEVVDAVAAADVDVFVYSGAPGAVLGATLLSMGKEFLHVHSGWLPEYRGSTTTYYELLQEGRIGVSALFLRERIDEGPIIARRQYPPPADRRTLDTEYDALVRADLLARVLRDYSERGNFPTQTQQPMDGGAYYIIHPVLKHIAVLAGDAPAVDAKEEL